MKKSSYSAAEITILGSGTALADSVSSASKLHLLISRLFIFDYRNQPHVKFSVPKSIAPNTASAILQVLEVWENLDEFHDGMPYAEFQAEEVSDSYYYFDEDPGVVNEWSYQAVDPNGVTPSGEVTWDVVTDPTDSSKWRVTLNLGEGRTHLYLLLTVRYGPTP